jgi:hypothetical protein
MIPCKPYVCGKHVESILGICKNMTKKVFNLNNTIPHSVRLVNPNKNLFIFVMCICVFTKKTGFWTKQIHKKTVAKVKNLRTGEKPSFAYWCICVQANKITA